MQFHVPSLGRGTDNHALHPNWLEWRRLRRWSNGRRFRGGTSSGGGALLVAYAEGDNDPERDGCGAESGGERA
jgi:hypothetical protein